MVDRVRPLKIEDSASGGTQNDLFPTTVNTNEDYLDARGVTLQNDTSDDDDVRVDRDASDNMVFQDGIQTTPLTLTQLLEWTSAYFIVTTQGGIVYDTSGVFVIKEPA